MRKYTQRGEVLDLTNLTWLSDNAVGLSLRALLIEKTPSWVMMELSQFPMPRRGPKMKDSQKSMEILEAYDLFGSYNGSANYSGCSPNTVKRLVQLRNAGQLASREQQQERPKSIDKFFFLVEDAVDKSKGKIRADTQMFPVVVHDSLFPKIRFRISSPSRSFRSRKIRSSRPKS